MPAERLCGRRGARRFECPDGLGGQALRLEHNTSIVLPGRLNSASAASDRVGRVQMPERTIGFPSERVDRSQRAA